MAISVIQNVHIHTAGQPSTVHESSQYSIKDGAWIVTLYHVSG